MIVDALRTVALASLIAYAPSSVATDFVGGTLGTPSSGKPVSGVGVISGFYCLSNPIEVLIDGESIGAAGGGTNLAAPRDYCGGRIDTGFSVLYNFNNLPIGLHAVSVRSAGRTLTSNYILTIPSAGVPWRTGLQRTLALSDFPEPGMRTTLTWSESSQSFVITKVDPVSADEACVGTMQRVDVVSRCATIPSNTATVPQLTGLVRCTDSSCWDIANASGKVNYLLTSMRETGKNDRPVVFAVYGHSSADNGRSVFEVKIVYGDTGERSPYAVNYDSTIVERVQSVRVIFDGLEIRRDTTPYNVTKQQFHCSVLRWAGAGQAYWQEYDAGPC